MRTGRAELPLHTGRAPRWLFSRMRRLAGAMAEILVEDRGPAELLRRLDTLRRSVDAAARGGGPAPC